MSRLSELDSLLYEYRKLNKISSLVLNKEMIHNPDFQLWVSNIVMDTVNYEKLLLQILASNFDINNDINRIAEIGSKPLLSSSEKITDKLVTSYNYSGYTNDFKVNCEFQKTYSYLNNDIDYIDLLVCQSNQFENINRQRDKMVFVHRLSSNQFIPFVIGCYGDGTSTEFKQRVSVLQDFSCVTEFDVDLYNETYNGLDCALLIGKEQKVKKCEKVKSIY